MPFAVAMVGAANCAARRVLQILWRNRGMRSAFSTSSIRTIRKNRQSWLWVSAVWSALVINQRIITSIALVLMRTAFSREKIMRRMERLLAIAGIGFGLVLPAKTLSAEPGTIPPGQWPELSAEWWQWAYSLPTSQNPIIDPTGAQCTFGQRGSIWFLAGDVPSRTCSVPEGVNLFFPAINVVNFNTPNMCGNGPENLDLNALRNSVKVVIDSAHDVSVTVDGQPIKKTLLGRVQSPVFQVALPAPPDNLCGDVPAGIYSPVVADGYYAALPPLSAGQTHTIHLHGEATFLGNPVSQDTTYELTVVPVKLK
jgi:hypothetical protein